jgi:hypothetical protein
MKTNEIQAKQVENLYLHFSIPERLEYDLDVCYDVEQDKMIYSIQDDKNSHLPVIFRIPSYVLGYFKGALGSKKFNKLKKDILRVLRDDFKTGKLLQKDSSLGAFLISEYNISLPLA